VPIQNAAASRLDPDDIRLSLEYWIIRFRGRSNAICTRADVKAAGLDDGGRTPHAAGVIP
jgi:hypothetical protein